MKIDRRTSFFELTFDEIQNAHGLVVEAKGGRDEADLQSVFFQPQSQFGVLQAAAREVLVEAAVLEHKRACEDRVGSAEPRYRSRLIRRDVAERPGFFTP